MPKTHNHRRRTWLIYLRGAELRAARNEAGLSQGKLAERLTEQGVVGMSQMGISRLETKREFPVDQDSMRIMQTILPSLQN